MARSHRRSPIPALHKSVDVPRVFTFSGSALGSFDHTFSIVLFSGVPETARHLFSSPGRRLVAIVRYRFDRLCILLCRIFQPEVVH